MLSTQQHHRLGLWQERVVIVGGLVVFAALGYFAIGLREVPATARWDLHTALDDQIPFWPVMMWFYAWVYTAMLYPAFVVGSRDLFRRVGLAYLIVVTVNLVCFLIFPATAELRPGPEVLDRLDLSWFHNWGLRVNYHLDPPTNLFPSLHLSSASLAGLAAWRARPAWGYLAAPLVVGIGAAICLVKQHYVVDGVAGLFLGAGVYLLVVHRWKPAEGERTALDWRGPLAYLTFHSSVYAGLYAAHLAGWRPWET